MLIRKINISNTALHHQNISELIDFTGGIKCFLFDAPMGAGKTTFISNFCSYLGSLDIASSPTYAFINEYHTSKGYKIFHADLYKLKNPTEWLELGLEDLTSDQDFIFIEWPKYALNSFNTYIFITIELINSDRILTAKIINNN